MFNLFAISEHFIILILLNNFVSLTKFARCPVCISIQSVSNSLEILISLIDGFTNKLVLIFFLNLSIDLIYFYSFLFKPPRINFSCLFSGTIQIKLGLIFKAFFTIASFVDISKFTKRFLIEHIFCASWSLMCLLSSLKCIVTESAPFFLQTSQHKQDLDEIHL